MHLKDKDEDKEAHKTISKFLYEEFRKRGHSPSEAREKALEEMRDSGKKWGKGGYYNEQGEHDPRGNPMERYKTNLHVLGDKVYSYHTHVANIKGGELQVLGYWSPTTSKHINYVAREMGLKVKHMKDDEKKEMGQGAGGNEESMNGYVGFYKDQKHEIYAKSSYEAQRKLAEKLHAKKPWEVTVVLAEKSGKPVTHSTTGVGMGKGGWFDWFRKRKPAEQQAKPGTLRYAMNEQKKDLKSLGY